MKRLFLLALGITMAMQATPASVAAAPVSGSAIPGVTLVAQGRSPYRIVIPRAATDVERKAAGELAAYLLKMSGASLPIVGDGGQAQAREILIGWTNQTGKLLHGFDLSSLKEDGFTIRTAGNKLIILGGTRKGTLYGVYTLLEEQLGCRMYAANAVVVPKRATITLPPLNSTQIPFFTHRQTHYLNAWNRAYSDWHKLLSRDDAQQEWGMWVHTFDRLLPAREHFVGHPDYYTLLGNRRIPTGQLCLSNPAVFPLLTQNLRAFMAKQPEARYWSVSQNDNFNECQCDSCRAQNARYGGSSGTMVAFVNRVAGLFPDKVISTLAYQYTRSAPAHITPAPNVNIMLCSIECNRSRPIATDPSSASFRSDVENWGRLTDNILMWDYVVQFRNLVSPFPNLRVLQPNIQYFARNNIRMMFQQGAGGNVAEFGELRTYLIAKLLWNPDCNIDSVMNDFLDGYYGPAGREIRSYIDIMHDALERSGGGLDIYGYPYDAFRSYLTPALIEEYTRLFDRAEQKVQSDSTFLERVRNARLPLEFAILDISLHDATPELSYFTKEATRWTVKPAMQQRLDAFVAQAKKAGIQRLEEMGTSPDDYRRSVQQLLRVSVQGNLAYGKPVQLLTMPSEKYPAGGAAALTNGLHGPNDYHMNWLGFEAEDLDAVIDLGKDTTVSSVTVGFLQHWYAWVWLPRHVDVDVSSDGKNYRLVSSMANTVPDTAAGAFTKQFTATFPQQKARFIRVSALSRKTCPDWHIGAGGKAWLFADEIVVR